MQDMQWKQALHAGIVSMIVIAGLHCSHVTQALKKAMQAWCAKKMGMAGIAIRQKLEVDITGMHAMQVGRHCSQAGITGIHCSHYRQVIQAIMAASNSRHALLA
jgi:hypothetical protein